MSDTLPIGRKVKVIQPFETRHKRTAVIVGVCPWNISKYELRFEGERRISRWWPVSKLQTVN